MPDACIHVDSLDCGKWMDPLHRGTSDAPAAAAPPLTSPTAQCRGLSTLWNLRNADAGELGSSLVAEAWATQSQPGRQAGNQCAAIGCAGDHRGYLRLSPGLSQSWQLWSFDQDSRIHPPSRLSSPSSCAIARHSAHSAHSFNTLQRPHSEKQTVTTAMSACRGHHFWLEIATSVLSPQWP